MSTLGQVNSASMNANTAKELALSDGDEYLGVPVDITETVADLCVFVNSNQATNIRSMS